MLKGILKDLYLSCVEYTNDKVLFLVMLLENIAMWIMTIAGLIVVVDASYKEDYTESLLVTGKNHNEEYITFITTGNSNTPVIHPESWSIIFKNSISCSVGEGLYENTNISDDYVVSYSVGISGLTYCWEVK